MLEEKAPPSLPGAWPFGGDGGVGGGNGISSPRSTSRRDAIFGGGGGVGGGNGISPPRSTSRRDALEAELLRV